MSTMNSLVILAVKRVMDKGTSAYKEAVDIYNTFFSNYMGESITFPLSATNEYLDYTIGNCMSQLSSELADERDQIVSNLEIIRDMDTFSDDSASATAINQFYDNGKGKFFIFMYAFFPKPNSEVDAEEESFSFNIRLDDQVIVLYNSKKTLYGTRKTEERQKIPAVISKETVINTSSIAFAPFVFNFFPGPYSVMEDLMAQANATKTTTAKDTHRMVYDSVTKSTVLATDYSVLKDIPTNWETVFEEHSLDIEQPVSPNYPFEF